VLSLILAFEEEQMEVTLTPVQSMKTDRFGDVTVLGSQYLDESDCLIWHFAVWSERDTDVKCYFVKDDGMPLRTERANDAPAMAEARAKWRVPVKAA
jgi:hypothetical protein